MFLKNKILFIVIKGGLDKIMWILSFFKYFNGRLLLVVKYVYIYFFFYKEIRYMGRGWFG